MSNSRIHAEMQAARQRLEGLEVAAEKERAWIAQLEAAIRVHERLGITQNASSDGETSNKVPSVKTPTKGRTRNETVVRAEQVLVAMLREAGDYIRQIDAVKRLREEHGIVVGMGVPGRETSDLSAALGAGKSRYLAVSRRYGWELREWNGLPPRLKAAQDGRAAGDAGDEATEEGDVPAA